MLLHEFQDKQPRTPLGTGFVEECSMDMLLDWQDKQAQTKTQIAGLFALTKQLSDIFSLYFMANYKLINTSTVDCRH